MILKTVSRHGLEPRHIVIELTEAVVMTHADRSAAILEKLHRSGFVVAVDDFGTGYSSLGYLKQLPIGKLKIDRSFIIDLGQNVKSDSIVKAVVMLAHGLGMSVVAEGVETAPQLSCLRELDCDQYQGYLFSRPQNATDIAKLMRRTPEIIGGLADPHWLLASSG
jgi:EAL domain-containing protein (putative c-di-GMP-specific phosphodiesterase class I)